LPVVRRYALVAIVLFLGAVLFGLQGGAKAQRPDRPWQPAPDAPQIIAQTGSAPTTHALEKVATPLPPTSRIPLSVIASTTKPSNPEPAPAPILRVSAVDLPAPAPKPLLALENNPAPRAEAAPVVPTATSAGPSAAVSVETVGPATVVVGQPFTYEIVVRNPGATPTLFVRVQDMLPENLRYQSSDPPGQMSEGQLLWDIGTLDAKAERRIKVSVQPTGEGEFTTTATATCSARTTMRVKVSQPKLSLVKKGPQSAQVGDIVAFELLVSNLGTGPAEKVTLRDKMPEGLQHEAQRTPGQVIEADIGTLAPGETRTIDMKAKALREGRFVNEAVVGAPGLAEVTARAEVIVTDATLGLSKNGPRESLPNQELDFTLVVSNTGKGTATGLKVTDTLPDGLLFVSAADGGTFDAKTKLVQWSIDSLAAGLSRTVSVRAKATKSGDWVNQAVARTERGQEARAEWPVHVEGVPALLLEVVDLDDPVEVGAETTYEIHVVNQGTAACTNVSVLCDPPEGLTVLDAEAIVTHKTEGKRLIFEPLPKLAAKADVRYRVKVKAIKAGDWRFRVWLSSDHMPKAIFEDESTQVYADDE
jgi:uncharacterized repeat protein (TIGR01451 family)